MRRLFLLALIHLAALALTLPAGAHARVARCGGKRVEPLPLHVGSYGRRTCGLQWLLSGQDPGAYRKTIHPFRGHLVTGQFGKRTARAVLAARWQLGEPVVYTKKCPSRTGKQTSVGADLLQILKGEKKRPLCWIGRASQRLKVERTQRTAQAPHCAQRLVAVAKHELALGVHEIPWGSNTGPRVRLYQSYTALRGTGWYWCMAFDQYVATKALGHWLDDGTAGVYLALAWGQRHGYIQARPVVGAFVLYLTNGGHTGIVTGVTPSGFSTIEGNSGRAWGGAVVAHSYPLGYRHSVFLVLPCAR